ncbi:MAG: SLC13 family permease [Candidatus Izemoplasmatales bacterium]|nr:SLC13 family permease [Candidatus Izemoplasmatales bacterium]MDD5293059.1 SLC13 family permease [Candidatus Izemoplasmatales bacterium]
MIQRIWRDKVFVIALLVMLASLFLTPPSLKMFQAINHHVLLIMFSLMIAVSGMTQANLFGKIAITLTSRVFTIRYIGLAIIWATFFLGMWMTNDAVLLTLVPFTIYVTKQTHEDRYVLPIVILQTFAANMGSALTPMGDPQNIYLYQYYQLGFGEFIRTTLPITVTSFILITVTTWFILPNTFIKPVMVSPVLDRKKVIVQTIIFILVLLSILRVIDIWIVFLVTVVLTLLFYPKLILKVDYGLLLTFVCFFITTYNLSQSIWLQNITAKFLDSAFGVYLSGLIFSQFMSNVPASVLLATFTSKAYWQPLLRGVNVGAMGSIIASLASLITFKFVIREQPERIKEYLKMYTLLGLFYILINSLVLWLVS